MSKPIIQQSLSEQAEERDAKANGRNAATLAGALATLGIGVSAVLTVIYLMLLVEEAANLPAPWGLLFGLLVGVVAVVPAEMATLIWGARLRADRAITTGQRATAVTAMVLAGLFSAMTTSSFFSYFLPQLFPPSYQNLAPTLNVGAIVLSWVAFIMATVFYGIFSRATRQNLSEAAAQQSIFDARMVVLRSAGEAIRLEAENMVNAAHVDGVFREDARRLILNSLGMDEERLTIAEQPAKVAAPTTLPGAKIEAKATTRFDVYYLEPGKPERFMFTVEEGREQAEHNARGLLNRYGKGSTQVRVGSKVVYECVYEEVTPAQQSFHPPSSNGYANGNGRGSHPDSGG